MSQEANCEDGNFLCRDKSWLQNCHRPRIQNACPKSCGVCSANNQQVQVLVTGNLQRTEIRQPNKETIVASFDEMNPTPVTTTEMIIKISSSSNLSFPNPVIVWCVGAIVLLGAVILLLAFVVLIIFEKKGYKKHPKILSFFNRSDRKGECIDTKSVAYGPTSIDSSLGYNDVEIDDLRLPFVDDSKDHVVNDSKQAYEIDASGKEVISRAADEGTLKHHFRSLWYEHDHNTLPKKKDSVRWMTPIESANPQPSHSYHPATLGHNKIIYSNLKKTQSSFTIPRAKSIAFEKNSSTEHDSTRTEITDNEEQQRREREEEEQMVEEMIEAAEMAEQAEQQAGDVSNEVIV